MTAPERASLCPIVSCASPACSSSSKESHGSNQGSQFSDCQASSLSFTLSVCLEPRSQVSRNRITGSWWHINHQHIQLPPVHSLYEAFEGAHDHRTPPSGCCVLLQSKGPSGSRELCSRDCKVCTYSSHLLLLVCVLVLITDWKAGGSLCLEGEKALVRFCPGCRQCQGRL